MERHFFKEDIQMAKRPFQKFSIWWSSGKSKFKLQWDITSPLSERLKSTTQEMTCVSVDVEKEEPSYTVGGNANWCLHSGKQYGVSSKKFKNISTLWLSDCITRYLPKKHKNSIPEEYGHPDVYSCITYNSQICK